MKGKKCRNVIIGGEDHGKCLGNLSGDVFDGKWRGGRERTNFTQDADQMYGVYRSNRGTKIAGWSKDVYQMEGEGKKDSRK